MKKMILILFVGILTGCATIQGYFETDEEKNARGYIAAHTRQEKVFNEKCETVLNKFEEILPVKNADDFISINVKSYQENGITITQNPTKTNPVLVAEIYNDTKELISTLDNLLGSALNIKDDNCNIAYRSGTPARTCYVNVSDSDCFKKLQNKKAFLYDILSDLRDPIYAKEEAQFKKHYSGEYKGDFKFCHGDCACPETGSVFKMPAGESKLLQNLGNAALLVVYFHDWDYQSNVIYVSSKIPQADGVRIDKEFFLQATGLKTYQTPIAATKTVCSYKILNYTDFKQKTDNFFFYPNFRTPTRDELCSAFNGWPNIKCKDGKEVK